jgi:hypothetical protein
VVAEGDETELFESFVRMAGAQRDYAVKRQHFSPEAAEAMAVQLHSGLVARYFTSEDDEEE